MMAKFIEVTEDNETQILNVEQITCVFENTIYIGKTAIYTNHSYPEILAKLKAVGCEVE